MKNVGDGRRVARVEKEVQIQIAQYLISGLSTPLPGLVTVTHVKMPSDLRTARVFISVLGEGTVPEDVIELLQKRAFEFQNYIGKQLKMRYCPKLTFMKDHTTEEVLKIEKILFDLNQARKPEDQSEDP
jgi:ribosome-binding factor A